MPKSTLPVQAALRLPRAQKNFYQAEYRLKARRRTVGGHNSNEPRRAGPWRPVLLASPGSWAGFDRALVAGTIDLHGWTDNCDYRIVRYARVKP